MQSLIKVISCCKCKGYVHKKCLKLSRKLISQLNDFVCANCTTAENHNDRPLNIQDENDNSTILSNRNENTTAKDIILEKYDNMIFNPIRFQSNTKDEEHIEMNHVPQCNYLTPEEFVSKYKHRDTKFSIMNANVRSINKNFEKLKECLKTVDHDFSIIGLSETHLKDTPLDYYNLDGYNMEYTNREGRQKGGVCLYVSNGISYKL